MRQLLNKNINSRQKKKFRGIKPRHDSMLYTRRQEEERAKNQCSVGGCYKDMKYNKAASVSKHRFAHFIFIQYNYYIYYNGNKDTQNGLQCGKVYLYKIPSLVYNTSLFTHIHTLGLFFKEEKEGRKKAKKNWKTVTSNFIFSSFICSESI